MSITLSYSQTEIDFLKSKDPQLASVIDAVGKIERAVTPDLFEALMHIIVGQQISTKAQATIWQRLRAQLTAVTPQSIAHYPADSLQQLGLSHRKVGYMQDIAEKVLNQQLDLSALRHMSDTAVRTELCKLRGIGVWSADMLMIFSMQRPNILSLQDLGIQRGLRLLYGHSQITRELGQRYQRRYAPYATVASLYLWAVAGGAVAELTDNKTPQNPSTTRLPPMKKTSQSALANRAEKVAYYPTELGNLTIVTNETHVTAVQFTKVDIDRADSQPSPLSEQAIQQIREYFAGERQQFDLPIKQAGTDFQQQVWQALTRIPYGQTLSYRQVAENVGRPKAYRAVGLANNRNKIAIIMPCHRVIGSNGQLVGYAGGLDIKQRLLALEATY